MDKVAKKACAAGDFRKGIQILADLYVRSDDPTYIYNQGRCYEQNHQWVSAIDRFREFQRKVEGTAAAKDAAEAEKHIAECRKYLAEEEARRAPPPQPPAAPVAPSAVTYPTAPAVLSPPPAATVAGPAEDRPGSGMRTAGLVAGGVGVASLATAVILNLRANHYADLGDESSQKPYKNGAIACYGVGGAALLTGAVLYVMGYSKWRADGAGVALLPTFPQGGAALSIGGIF